MSKFLVEVVAHGRLSAYVEAESEEEAERIGYETLVPDFDKLYDSDVYVIAASDYGH